MVDMTRKQTSSDRPARPEGPPPLRYRCRACDAMFDLPAPKGPAEEKARVCPNCGSGDLGIRPFRSRPCPPGG
jgi:DNA-directed RNA polymerase subunit RPC12/RpoP